MVHAYNFDIEPEIQEKLPGFNLTASIGVAHAPTHSLDAEKLFECADKAAYHVKNILGRGNFAVYKRGM